MWKIIRFLWNNERAKRFLLNMVKFSKDGYSKFEIATLISDVLGIFRIPVEINYQGNEVHVKFIWNNWRP